MIRRTVSAIGALAIALLAAGQAQARSYGRDEYGSGNWPSELVERPLTLAEDLGELDVPVVFNLTDGYVWKPVFMPVRLAYGVNSDFTLAVTHQIGFCLGGTPNGCAKLYNDVGLEGLFAVVPFGPLQAALAAGVELPSIADPFAASAVVGFDSRLVVGPVALRLDPRLRIGVNQRDLGNKEFLSVPVTAQLQVTAAVALFATAAVNGPLNPDLGSFSDYYMVPLNVGLTYGTGDFDFGASFRFLDLRGKILPSATGARVGQVFGSVRF
jgi:hypothetical protein